MKSWSEHKQEMLTSSRNEWIVALIIGIVVAIILTLAMLK
jgi:hypothetical protein